MYLKSPVLRSFLPHFSLQKCNYLHFKTIVSFKVCIFTCIFSMSIHTPFSIEMSVTTFLHLNDKMITSFNDCA